MGYAAIISRMPGKRVRYGAIKSRMADGSEGKRMRCIKGARHAHAAIRASGRRLAQEACAVAAARRHILRLLRTGMESHRILAKLKEMGFGHTVLNSGETAAVRGLIRARETLWREAHATPYERAKLKFRAEQSESHPLYAMANRWDMTPGKHVK